MSYEEDDTVVLHDKHSEHDGEQGQITQVMQTMFGDETYTISFEDGQEAGIPADQLELVEDETGESAEEDEKGADEDGDGAEEAAEADEA